MCSECKIGFAPTDNFKCSDCSQRSIYIQFFFVFILKLLFFFYANWIALKKNKNINDINGSKGSISAVKSSYMIRLLMFYFTYSSIFKVLLLESEFILYDISLNLISTSPSENFNIFSFGCLLYIIGIKTSSIYVVALGTFAFVIFSFILINILVYPNL